MDDERLPVVFGADDMEAVDAALEVLEQRLASMISLRPAIEHSWARMGAASEAFCRETLAAMAAHHASMCAEFDLERAHADLTAADALHPRLLRLRQLTERAEDTETALGCDVMVAALQAQALLAATRFEAVPAHA